MTSLSTPPPTSRWTITGIVAMLVAFAIMLVVTNWVEYAHADAVSDVLARGEGEDLVRAVTLLVPPNQKPSSTQLAAVLADERDHGLRYIGLVDATGTLVASAGDSADPRTITAMRPPFADAPPPMLRVGARWRSVAPRFHRPPRPGFDPPPDELGLPPPPRFEGEPPPGASGSPRARPMPPIDSSMFVIEFEPIVAAQMRREAARALGVGVASAAALLLAAVLLRRWVSHHRRMETRLAHESRLAALGQMSAVLAHEIRNPLASLKGHAQLLAEGLDDPPKDPVAERDRDRAKAGRIVDDVVRLERLALDLLEFVRSGRIERRECDPGAVLADAARAVDSNRIALDIAAAPSRWQLDPERIAQVLTNLLQNAVQSGGAVEASASVEARALVFRVRDHGPGLPAGDVDAIFEPFQTTRVRGIGLGLAVARRLVELHQGAIAARNHPDGGAELTVRIPEH